MFSLRTLISPITYGTLVGRYALRIQSGIFLGSLDWYQHLGLVFPTEVKRALIAGA
jgi:hypothetical protein